MEVKDLSCLSSNKIVYCTMEVDGGDKLQTDQAEASKPWSVRLVSYSLCTLCSTTNVHDNSNAIFMVSVVTVICLVEEVPDVLYCGTVFLAVLCR